MGVMAELGWCNGSRSALLLLPAFCRVYFMLLWKNVRRWGMMAVASEHKAYQQTSIELRGSFFVLFCVAFDYIKILSSGYTRIESIDEDNRNVAMV